MTQQTRLWLLAFVLLGLASSIASLYIHDRILRDPSYSSFCNVTQTFSCEIAYQSRFATVRGVPVALGGVIWFTLALLLILAGDTKAGPGEYSAAAYLFLGSIPALSVVLYLAYASLFVLKVVCIPCVLTYVAVLGVFVVSGASANARLSELPQQAVRDARSLAARPIALGVAILFLTGAVAALSFFPRPVGDPTAALASVMAQQPTDFDLWFESQVRVPVGLPADGAQVLIVKFTDYQCPACAETHRADGAVLAKYERMQPGKVKVILKDYPQDAQCNPHIGETVHDTACEGAAAVRLAEGQQRAAAMEEWLYTHQVGLTPAAVRQAAMDIGGITDFDSQFPRVLASIRDDVELGRRLGVRGTPTLFINGVRIEGGPQPELLDQAIAHELRVSAKP